jgi:YbbR domain-containing protein
METLLRLFRRFSLQFWAVVIAVALWLQVHGQGEGSLSMDVPLQVQGLPAEMVIINDLPDHVRITINGLQTRLKDLHQEDLTVPVNASDITSPGVVERALQLSSVSLPVGLYIEKVQPDRLELQVDRVVTRSIPVRDHFELPEGWHAREVTLTPKNVELTGPEVWLDALREVETSPIRPDLKSGVFETKTGVESPSGKAIRLVNSKVQIVVKAVLMKEPGVPVAKDLSGGE